MCFYASRDAFNQKPTPFFDLMKVSDSVEITIENNGTGLTKRGVGDGGETVGWLTRKQIELKLHNK